MELIPDYWNHNVAYHGWILRQIDKDAAVLDVGCGDGLLLYKLAGRCKMALGLEVHGESLELAAKRLADIDNAGLIGCAFEDWQPEENLLFDAIVFVASIHHMDMDAALQKAKDLLSERGKLIIVGVARKQSLADWLVEGLRIVPAKIGSMLHGETVSESIGLPTAAAGLSVGEIRGIANKYFTSLHIRRGLYYRYLLAAEK